ncbi:MAG: SLATT domain-containing protein [Bacteroidia bacterium]|nr:SLATT domain-containing protein [Bacteroidia bacterium]
MAKNKKINEPSKLPDSGTSGKSYLDGDFGKELNLKLWTTKGARFAASHRLKTKGRLSTYSLGMLSIYVIVVNLCSVYGVEIPFSNSEIGLITTSLSILILVLGQLEMANEYSLRSVKFHDCALEIGELYNKWRFYKNEKSRNKSLMSISESYEKVLLGVENHEPIDYDVFKIKKREYFKLGDFEVLRIRVKYYFIVKFIYHFIIFSPIFTFLWMYSQK